MARACSRKGAGGGRVAVYERVSIHVVRYLHYGSNGALDFRCQESSYLVLFTGTHPARPRPVSQDGPRQVRGREQMLSAQLSASLGLYRLYHAAWVLGSRYCCQARNEASVPQFSERTRHKSPQLAKHTMHPTSSAHLPDDAATCRSPGSLFHEIGIACRAKALQAKRRDTCRCKHSEGPELLSATAPRAGMRSRA